MRKSIRSRFVIGAVASASLMLVPFAQPASAVAAASCKTLISPAPVGTTSKSTLTGCLPLAATGGSGKSVTNLKTLVSVTTWAGGKGTTTAKISYKAGPAVNKCPKGTTLIISSGKVTASTGAAAKVIKVGQVVSASVCVTSKSTATLEPGTTYNF